MLRLTPAPLVARRRDNDPRKGGQPCLIEVGGQTSPDGEWLSCVFKAAMPGAEHGPYRITVMADRAEPVLPVVSRFAAKIQALACTDVTVDGTLILVRPAFPYRTLTYDEPSVIPNIIRAQVIEVDGEYVLKTPQKAPRAVWGNSPQTGKIVLEPTQVGFYAREAQKPLSGFVGQNIAFDTR